MSCCVVVPGAAPTAAHLHAAAAEADDTIALGAGAAAAGAMAAGITAAGQAAGVGTAAAGPVSDPAAHLTGSTAEGMTQNLQHAITAAAGSLGHAAGRGTDTVNGTTVAAGQEAAAGPGAGTGSGVTSAGTAGGAGVSAGPGHLSGPTATARSPPGRAHPARLPPGHLWHVVAAMPEAEQTRTARSSKGEHRAD